MKTNDYAVSGMTCAACAVRIEKVLSKLSGVTTATVNIGTEKLKISYDESRLDKDNIAATVEKIGYKLTPVGGDE